MATVVSILFLGWVVQNHCALPNICPIWGLSDVKILYNIAYSKLQLQSISDRILHIHLLTSPFRTPVTTLCMGKPICETELCPNFEGRNDRVFHG